MFNTIINLYKIYAPKMLWSVNFLGGTWGGDVVFRPFENRIYIYVVLVFGIPNAAISLCY